jgi:hypothetical protein
VVLTTAPETKFWIGSSCVVSESRMTSFRNVPDLGSNMAPKPYDATDTNIPTLSPRSTT